MWPYKPSFDVDLITHARYGAVISPKKIDTIVMLDAIGPSPAPMYRYRWWVGPVTWLAQKLYHLALRGRYEVDP